MKTTDEIEKFIEYDRSGGRVVEPVSRMDMVLERLLDVIKEHNPGVIVKAGLGRGDIARILAEQCQANLVVVEPSQDAIRRFLSEYGGNEAVKRIRFINGGFHEFPIDYYKADMVVSIDTLNLYDSSRTIDEFKRALRFEGILFLAGVVLDNDDVQGVYDDFYHLIMPLHNDYYLEDDLKTFLELKDFRYVKGSILANECNLPSLIDYMGSHFREVRRGDAAAFLEKNAEVMRGLYAMDDSGTCSEPYIIGCFMRNRPAKDQR